MHCRSNTSIVSRMGNSPRHQFHTRELKKIVTAVVVCVCLTPPCLVFEDDGMLRFVTVLGLAVAAPKYWTRSAVVVFVTLA